MSGLGPTLYLPHGASAQWLQAIAKPEDGSAIDLTLATAIEWILKRSATVADADAEVSLAVADGITVIDAVAGLIKVALTAAQSLAREPYGRYFYFTRVTFPDRVVIPDNLRGTFLNDPASAEEQDLDGGPITRLDAATGTLTPVTPDMSNYTINRYDLTGLTGGANTDLDGLSAETLAQLSNGAVLELFFPGSISARFRLRAMVGTEAEAAPWLIICDNAPTRVLELIGQWKQGAPGVWNPDTDKFHQLLASGTSTAIVPALADEADAFVLPA